MQFVHIFLADAAEFRKTLFLISLEYYHMIIDNAPAKSGD